MTDSYTALPPMRLGEIVLATGRASQGADWWLVGLLPGPPDSGPTQEAQ